MLSSTPAEQFLALKQILYCVQQERVHLFVCTVKRIFYLALRNQLQLFALIFPFSRMGKNVERHSLTLWTLASFKIQPCHMGEAQSPGLMQRKVAPSWPGVKTLINTHTHTHLFSQTTAGECDEAELGSPFAFCHIL